MRRAALVFARIAVVALALPLAACADNETTAPDASGQLFTRGLDEIPDLYIEPVTNRKLALAGAARLSRLDDKLAVTERNPGGLGPALILSYAGRELAAVPMPAEADTRGWGEAIAQLIAAARAGAPNLAGMRRELASKAVFDGMTATLDRFSRYSPPEAARNQRAARDGFGGVGITLEMTADGFKVAAVTANGPAAQAGLQAGDTIVAIDGVATSGLSQSDVIQQLRGPVGSGVAIRVARVGVALARDFDVRRALVVLPTVAMSRVGDIALFQVSSFKQSTT